MAAKKIVESDFPDVKMVEYDCDKEKELCGKNQVKGYPTILIENTSGDKTPFQGSRDKASFVRAAETLSKKSTLTFKSLRDSYLNKSEFPLKIHQLLSLDDLFGNQTGGDLIVVVFPEQIEPRQFFKSIEIISNSIAESACKSATFLFYFPTDSAINQFLSLPETPMKKIVKVAANTTYVVDSVMDSDIAAYIASCNLSNKAKLFDIKSVPLFKNQKPYIPLYTVIDKYVEDLVAELKKTIKKPIQIIYEDQNILLDIDGLVEDISRQYDITDTSKTAEAVRNKFLDRETLDL
ncbi:MAG: protein disulfide-isomerase precursor [Marteilia pararefringens]